MVSIYLKLQYDTPLIGWTLYSTYDTSQEGEVSRLIDDYHTLTKLKRKLRVIYVKESVVDWAIMDRHGRSIIPGLVDPPALE